MMALLQRWIQRRNIATTLNFLEYIVLRLSTYPTKKSGCNLRRRITLSDRARKEQPRPAFFQANKFFGSVKIQALWHQHVIAFWPLAEP